MKVNDDLKIEINYDESFERQVRGEGRAYNPLVDFTITCGNVSLSGPEEGYVDGYALNVLHGLLDAVEALRLGQRCVVSAPEDTVRFVFEPNGDAVVYTICIKKECVEDTSDRIADIEPQVIVSKRVLISEIIRATHQFIEKVSKADPNIRNKRIIQELEGRLYEIEGDDGYNNTS